MFSHLKMNEDDIEKLIIHLDPNNQKKIDYHFFLKLIEENDIYI
jgi:hypothetical protein